MNIFFLSHSIYKFTKIDSLSGLISISFANKLFVLENIENTNTHKNKIILFIKKIYLILSSYANKVIWKNVTISKQI